MDINIRQIKVIVTSTKYNSSMNNWLNQIIKNIKMRKFVSRIFTHINKHCQAHICRIYFISPIANIIRNNFISIKAMYTTTINHNWCIHNRFGDIYIIKIDSIVMIKIHNSKNLSSNQNIPLWSERWNSRVNFRCCSDMRTNNLWTSIYSIILWGYIRHVKCTSIS